MEIRTTSHNKLKEIQDDVLKMGTMMETAIDNSVEALKRRDISLAHQVIANDVNINEK